MLPLYFNLVNRHGGIMLFPKPKVALFVTCLVDLFRPSVGFAAVKLLKDAGCKVYVPENQTCCGQPAYNAGNQETTKEIARNVIDTFESFDYVITPSGSCAGMIREHYTRLFEGIPIWQDKSKDLAGRVYELMSFLVDVLDVKEIASECESTVTYHDSCSGLRELCIKKQPRQLLSFIKGLIVEEYSGAESCCGFGGTFCIKYSDISNKIVETRISELAETKVDMVLGGDLGCLMNLAGKLKRENSSIQVRHTAEILAGLTDEPAIGEGDN